MKNIYLNIEKEIIIKGEVIIAWNGKNISDA